MTEIQIRVLYYFVGVASGMISLSIMSHKSNKSNNSKISIISTMKKVYNWFF